MYDEWLRLFWKGRFLLEIKVPNDPRFVIFGSKRYYKIMKKHEKRGLEAPKIHKKSIKMVPRSAPKTILEVGPQNGRRVK